MYAAAQQQMRTQRTVYTRMIHAACKAGAAPARAARHACINAPPCNIQWWLDF